MHIYTFQKAHWTISLFIEQREDGKLPEIASVDTTKLHNVCVHNTHNCWKENEREQSERTKKTNCKKNSKLKCQKRIPRSNCEYYAYLWKSISRFGPFEDRPAQHSTAEREHEHTHSSSAWMRKMCCGKHSFYLPVCQPACLLACQPSIVCKVSISNIILLLFIGIIFGLRACIANRMRTFMSKSYKK